MITTLWQLLYFFCAVRIVSCKWSTTKFLFAFGDSYTTDGFNISAGVDSPVPGFVSTYGVVVPTFLDGRRDTRIITDIFERP